MVNFYTWSHGLHFYFTVSSKISSRSHMYAVKTSHVLNSMENVRKVPFKVDTENNLLISQDKSCNFET